MESMADPMNGIGRRRSWWVVGAWALAVGLGTGAVSARAETEPCPAGPSFRSDYLTPIGETSPRLDAARSALAAYAFDADAGYRTDGLLVVHEGRVLFEDYDHGFDRDTPHLTWSISKSVTSALLGIALAQERLELEAPVAEVVDLDLEPQIRVRHLLEWSSGFDWNETYEEDESPQASSVIAMLYGEGRSDMAAFVADHPLRDPPGATWMYSSGDSVLLMAVVRAALEPVYGPEFPWTVLFEPLGMAHTVYERDAAGTYVGASYVYASPRDLARFGQLYLEEGCFGGERRLPASFVREAQQVPRVFRERALRPSPGYISGRHWWLNRDVGPHRAPFPSVPADAYAARGHWGQELLVVPSRRAVVVRTGEDRKGQRIDFDRLYALALQVIEARP
jgi:CubicO group peptidase (beta-lactamase class C family)